MKKLQIICLLLFVGFSTVSSAYIYSEVTMTMTKGVRRPMFENFETHLVKAGSFITFKCTYNGREEHQMTPIVLYSVGDTEFGFCSLKGGKVLSHASCRPNRAYDSKAFGIEEGETHHVIGFHASPEEYVDYRGCRQEFPVTRFILYVCDPLAVQGNICSKKSCQLSVGARIPRKLEMTANSELDNSHEAEQGWLSYFSPSYNSPWCAAPNDRRVYLQVSLYYNYRVTAVATQGAGTENSWVSSYLLEYRNLDWDWIVLTDKGGNIKEFNGNSDRTSIVRHWIRPHFYTMYVRCYPLSWVGQRCMRMELHGCELSYSEKEKVRHGGKYKKEPSFCEAVHCASVPHSSCFMYSGKPRCKCVQPCAPSAGKFCGADGVTYQNECKLQKAACIKRKQINITEWKPCPDCWLSLVVYGQVRDEQLSASSELDDFYAAKQGRVSLIIPSKSSPWCADPTSDPRSQYLQVDLLTIHGVSVVSTQGAVTENSWVTSYLVHYILDGNEWIVLADKGGKIKEFNGNSDNSSIVRHWFKPYLRARLVRFVPLLWIGRLCMRVELRGCGLHGVDLKGLKSMIKNEPRLCEAAHCASVPYSTCLMYSGKPLCNCVQACAPSAEKVCGTDGVTYLDECEMKKTACSRRKQINILQWKPCPACSLSLGLGDGRITDEQLSASSELDDIHAAKQGRVSLINPSNNSPWCAAPMSDLRSQHLQVDLLKIHNVSAVSTQGAVTENSWVSSYLVHYSLDGNDWIVLTDEGGEIKEFKGNSDQSSLVHHWLKPRFHARFVRFFPLSWVGQRCMRVELHGCNKANTSFEKLRGNLKNEPRPCEAAHCTSTPHSICFMHSGEPLCKCLPACDRSKVKFCGTDGVTYYNECDLQKAACLGKKQIYSLYRDRCPECFNPVVRSNDQLSASSELDDIHAAKQGKVSLISPSKNSSSWCAAPTSDLISQHLQVDLGDIYYLIIVSTQGSGTENSWVSSYLVHHSLDGKDWMVFTDGRGEIKEFNGNSDQSSIVHHWLWPTLDARFVRFVPLRWVGQLCMRVELYGCLQSDASLFVPSYRKRPQNDPRLCEAAHCASVPHSTCFMYSGKPTCKCVQSCALSAGKVCGTDGLTYDNECELKKAACLSKKQISISKRLPCPACPLSLGLGDGRIRDEQLSASSELDDIHEAKQGRVSLTSLSNNSSSWCAAPMSDLRSQHLQVDLLTIYYVSAVSTQGAVTENSWVNSYLVHYSLDGNDWIVLTEEGGEIKEFNGNSDQSSLVHHWLKPHFHARFVRFVPLWWVGQRCLRVELHGCNKANTSFEKLSGNLTNEPRPCEAAHCASVPHSTCFMYSGKPTCKCVQSCALSAGRVCGTDGVTYQNECELKKAVCLSKKQIKWQPCPACPLSLGLSDGRIRDEQLSASSKLDDIHAAKQGRVSLTSLSNSSSWCAAPMSDLRSQHLQVDLLTIHYVSAVSTQGAVTENSWVSSYLVHYSLDGKEWIVLTDEGGEIKEFNGNSDQSSLVHHWLRPHFHARFVRFVPLTWVSQRCMRVELHGCNKTNTSFEKLSGNLTNEPRPCEAAHCASVPHSTCFMYSGKPLCKCVKSCALSAGEVCGTDGVTYPNECEMKNAACLSKKQISISKRQPCPEGVDFHLAICGPSVCPPYSICESGDICVCTQCSNDGKKVCGSDGKTYKDFCELEKVACESNTTLKMTRKGSCQECAGKTCPPYANCVHSDSGDVCVCPDCSPKGGKVCGTDGKTYKHSCELQTHACKENKNISIVSQGGCAEGVDFPLAICGPFVCPPYSTCESGDICVCTQCWNDGKKVCGSDGKTYKDFCELQKFACESNTTLKMTRKGSCQECAGKTCPPHANCVHSDSGDVCVCPDCSPKGGKVCGSDGKTYKHSCELQTHACKKNKHISIVSQGGCAGSGKKEHKLSHSFVSSKTFYICMIAIGALGIAIVLAMFLFQHAERQTGKDGRKVSDLQKTENPFDSLQVEDNSQDDK